MKHKWLIAMMVSCAMLWGSAATAQQPPEEDNESTRISIALVFLSSSSWFGFALSYIPLAQSLEEKELKDDMEELRQFVMIKQFVTHNQANTQMALSVGGGAYLRDLARIMGVAPKQMPKWSRWVRANRKVLLSALSSEDADQRAKQFQRILLSYKVKQNKGVGHASK